MQCSAIIVTLCLLALIAAGKQEVMEGSSYGHPYRVPPYAAPPTGFPYGSLPYPAYGSSNGPFYR